MNARRRRYGFLFSVPDPRPREEPYAEHKGRLTPANLARLLLARLLWRYQCRRERRIWGWVYPRIGGRHVDWQPWLCTTCGYIGPLRWFVHSYEDDGTGEDVVACDECPECCSSLVIPWEERDLCP